MTEAKRSHMREALSQYAAGKTYREIQDATGISRGSISGLLHEAERLAGVSFLPGPEGGYSAKAAIAQLTRATRQVGARNASVRDFHSLRTSFVTLALQHGVPVEKITAMTGHRTVETAMKFYAQTKGTDFRADFEKALPKALTEETAKLPASPTAEQPPDAARQAQLEKIAAKLKAVTAGLSPEDVTELKRILNRQQDAARIE